MLKDPSVLIRNIYRTLSHSNIVVSLQIRSHRSDFPTVMMAVRRAVLVPIMTKQSRNQVDQMTLLVTPVALRVSFRRSSFSRTILLTIMDTE